MTWTEAQQIAIIARDCYLLVAAAAGSGNTAVLVERIIILVLEDGVDIDRMLIVTFTQAAAGEMRERISNALQSELESNPENEQHLRRQLKLLNQASISTIHAFCTDVIRRYFHLVGIDPGFRISDSMESDLIKMETLEDFFEACYEKETDIFYSWWSPLVAVAVTKVCKTWFYEPMNLPNVNLTLSNGLRTELAILIWGNKSFRNAHGSVT